MATTTTTTNNYVRQHYRIILLGKYSVGKTSFARALSNPLLCCYPEDADTISTIGIDFVMRDIVRADGGGKATLQIWDTAGQCEYDAICRNYYRQCECALILFDLFDPESWHRAEKWYWELYDYDPTIAAVFVGNKSDLVNAATLRPEQTLRWHKTWQAALDFSSSRVAVPLVAMSNFTGEGIPQVLAETLDGCDRCRADRQMIRMEEQRDRNLRFAEECNRPPPPHQRFSRDGGGADDDFVIKLLQPPTNPVESWSRRLMNRRRGSRSVSSISSSSGGGGSRGCCQ